MPMLPDYTSLHTVEVEANKFASTSTVAVITVYRAISKIADNDY
jgi:hypothetical protein